MVVSVFDDQLDLVEARLARMRVATTHRAGVTMESPSGPVKLSLPNRAKTADDAKGYWIVADLNTRTPVRRLGRKTTLQRRT